MAALGITQYELVPAPKFLDTARNIACILHVMG